MEASVLTDLGAPTGLTDLDAPDVDPDANQDAPDVRAEGPTEEAESSAEGLTALSVDTVEGLESLGGSSAARPAD